MCDWRISTDVTWGGRVWHSWSWSWNVPRRDVQASVSSLICCFGLWDNLELRYPPFTCKIKPEQSISAEERPSCQTGYFLHQPFKREHHLAGAAESPVLQLQVSQTCTREHPHFRLGASLSGWTMYKHYLFSHSCFFPDFCLISTFFVLLFYIFSYF